MVICMRSLYVSLLLNFIILDTLVLNGLDQIDSQAYHPTSMVL